MSSVERSLGHASVRSQNASWARQEFLFDVQPPGPRPPIDAGAEEDGGEADSGLAAPESDIDVALRGLSGNVVSTRMRAEPNERTAAPAQCRGAAGAATAPIRCSVETHGVARFGAFAAMFAALSAVVALRRRRS